MEQTTPPIDLVQTAMQTYSLSLMVDEVHEQALRVAIQSVLEVHRAQVVSEVCDTLQRYSEDLYDTVEVDEDDTTSTGAVYIAYAVQLVRKMGHPEIEIGTYVPKDQDLIQIITTGKVHKHSDSSTWTLELDLGDILDFDIKRAEPSVRVRLLDRDENG
jgi:hypothetical protein